MQFIQLGARSDSVSLAANILPQLNKHKESLLSDYMEQKAIDPNSPITRFFKEKLAGVYHD